jgi:plastocyanin
MRPLKLLIVFSLLLILSLLPSVCLAEEKEEKNVFEATVDEDGVQRVEVVAGSYYFNPDHIIVKKGIPVELKVRKEPGLVPHNLVINGKEEVQRVKESLSPEPRTITLTFEEAGTYGFWCDKKLLFFKSHRAKGMEGIIEVVE